MSATHYKLAATFVAMKEKDGILNDIAVESAEVRTAYYYLKRYKIGYRDWDVMNGGDCRITPLGKLTRTQKTNTVRNIWVRSAL